MADNIHPVVELLAARMESHPEEFEPNGGGRWAEWLDRLIPFVTEEERVMLRGPMMQDIHEEVLDELMNGPERRAEERRKTEELEKLKAQQLYNQVQQQMNAVDWGRQNNLLRGASQLGGANGYPYYDSITDTYEFGNGMKMTKAQVESDPSLIAKMKKALGL